MIQKKGETGTRRCRLYDASFSELRGCLMWEFLKHGKRVLPVPACNTPVNTSNVVESTGI
ncbi:hypothetical protein B9Q06_04175 [Candidatus Marsarchaeota G2 archaeon ECH_B_2]|uniref:Uncharacterized protein n=3 Tax=Candidatus Marsarchaeota group 2 TaxID=2203771 RepID=A0A2R6BAU4_9ARCH|nr:MAG: hypothetical protein B9Q06_04175 [Candidatus Marsarchaeota G2 archaeon ECH_B_2]PSO00553.1 MAG: hypothetical protein B9Q07_03005 [Candidatus Marsarchaeota G2 archaeon ECH_B_3]PSO03148.1 MAG: hypothetical protein B9Q05_02045 [Candidatus Marsarchaeota G2 archaeon ECH_B_1]